MSKELITFDKDELALIKTTIAKNTSDDELRLFIQVCKQTGLNPFARQIYAVKRGSQMTIQTSIDGYRLLAQRSGEYAGQDGPYYYDSKTKDWSDVWCESYPPAAARVGVLRKGFQKYLYAVARFESYVVKNNNSNNLWEKMPEVMIAKVAEALALRRAFPAELSGLYTKEEMDQADAPLPTPSVNAQAQPQEPTTTVEGNVVPTPLHDANSVYSRCLRARVCTDVVSFLEYASSCVGMAVTSENVKTLTQEQFADIVSDL